MNETALEAFNIEFNNRHHALAVSASSKDSPQAILQALNLPPIKAVILVLGGQQILDETSRNDLSQLFNRALSAAADESSSLIINCGTEGGIANMIGNGIGSRGYRCKSIGIVPGELVTFPGDQRHLSESNDQQRVLLDDNQTHFVLTDGDAWGHETSVLFQLVEELSLTMPVIVLLVGGLPSVKQQVLRAVRNRWQIFVVGDSCGLADEVADAWLIAENFADHMLAEIIEEGEVFLANVMTPSTKFRRFLSNRLHSNTDTIRMAWEAYVLYNYNAKRHEKNFFSQQGAVLILGVLSTLVVLTKQFEIGILLAPMHMAGIGEACANGLLKILIVSMPLAATAILTYANLFKPGVMWVQCFATAGAIQSQIFRYRTRSGPYSSLAAGVNSREMLLADKVKSLTQSFAQSEGNSAAMLPYNGPIPPTSKYDQYLDDGIRPLKAQDYLNVRLETMLAFYNDKCPKLEALASKVQWGIVGMAFLGSLFAAIDLDLWIAATTSIATALTTFIGLRQYDFLLKRYNVAKSNLLNIKAWWTALSEEEKLQQSNLDKLVSSTEQAIENQMQGWVQQMKDALAELGAIKQDEEQGGRARGTGKQPFQVTSSYSAREDSSDKAPSVQLRETANATTE